MAFSVLYLSHLGGLGGGESSLLANILALDRSQFQPRVVCGTPGAFVEALRRQDIPTQVIPFALPYFRGIVPIASLDFFPRFDKSLRAVSTHLIHCNDPEGAYYAAPLAKLRHLPILWTCWGWWQAERGWKSFFYEKMLTHIITPTAYLKQCLVHAHPRLERKITVLPFGVDTDVFAPGPRDKSLLDELHLDPEAPLVTLLARFQSVKGHENFLNAAPQILDTFPTARFLFVGDSMFDTKDANDTRRSIRERVAADARLRAAVVFCGFRHDIPRILRASHVLVCPSEFETYGMANLEAMSCGIPVVSTNVGGPAETIVEGETGFLVPPRDPNALGARVIQILASAELAHRIGVRARQRVLNHYRLHDRVAQLQQVYYACLTRRA